MEDNTVRDDNGEITESGGLGAFEVRIGDCINFPDDAADSELIYSVEGVPCSSPHDEEVYHEFDLVGLGPGWPGDAPIEDRAIDECLAAFEPYVGRDYQTSDLDFYYWSPSEGSWGEGDRTVSCLAFQMDGLTLRSSIKNSGR